MRTLTLALAAAVAAAAVGVTAVARDSLAAHLGIAPTPEQRFRHGMIYEAFAESDTAKHALWAANAERAKPAVDSVLERARAIPGDWHLLVVAESWCSDAANSVPYLARLAAAAGNVDLRLVRKAQAKPLLRAHLLDGRDATPLVLVYDDAWTERGVWIERPAALRALIAAHEPRLAEDSLRTEVRAWYRADAGRAVLAEVITIMERAAAGLPTPAAASGPSTCKGG